MAELNHSCSICQGQMEEGFIADRTGDGGVDVTDWVEGKPKRSFLTGVKTVDKEMFEISTYRCTSCGHLQLYAK